TIGAGALTFTSGGGTLDGVTLSGDFSSLVNTGVSFTGGTAFTGANALLGSSSYLYWQQAATLVAKAVTFNPGAYVYINGANNTLTLDAASTATGQVEIYSDGSVGTAFTNQGHITHTTGTGYLYGNTTTNSGTITISGGALTFGSSAAGATLA